MAQLLLNLYLISNKVFSIFLVIQYTSLLPINLQMYSVTSWYRLDLKQIPLNEYEF